MGIAKQLHWYSNSSMQRFGRISSKQIIERQLSRERRVECSKVDIHCSEGSVGEPCQTRGGQRSDRVIVHCAGCAGLYQYVSNERGIPPILGAYPSGYPEFERIVGGDWALATTPVLRCEDDSKSNFGLNSRQKRLECYALGNPELPDVMGKRNGNLYNDHLVFRKPLLPVCDLS